MLIAIILIHQLPIHLKDWILFWWFCLLCSLVAGGLKIKMVQPEVLTLKSKTTWSISARWLERCLNCCPGFLNFFFFLPIVWCHETHGYSCHALCETIWSDYRHNSRTCPLVAKLYEFGPLDKSGMTQKCASTHRSYCTTFISQSIRQSDNDHNSRIWS